MKHLFYYFPWWQCHFWERQLRITSCLINKEVRQIYKVHVRSQNKRTPWKMCVYLFCFVCCWGFWSVRWLTVHTCGLPLPEARRVRPHCCWCKPPTEREKDGLSEVENADIKISRLFHSPHHFTSSSAMKMMTVLIPVDNSIKLNGWHLYDTVQWVILLLTLHEGIKKSFVQTDLLL